MHVSAERVFCPLDPQIGGGTAELHERSLGWMLRVGLAPDEATATKIASARFGDLASRAYPKASLNDRLLITGWLIYVAVLDDQYDDLDDLGAIRSSFGNIARYLRTGRYPRIGFAGRSGSDNPIHRALENRALENLWRRTAAPMPATWRMRFADSMAAFLDGVATEARHRQTATQPSLDEYLRLRRPTSACGPLFDLIQLGTHRPLADAVHFYPAVIAVRETATDVVAWINDLASMNKEEAAGSGHNLVLVLRRTGGLSASLACAVATDMVNDGIRRLWRDAAALPDFGGGLTDYVDGLKTWVRANIDWSARSGRYQLPEMLPDHQLK